MLKSRARNHFEMVFKSVQQSSTFLAPGICFVEDNFSTDGGRGMASGCFKWTTFIVYFISIITSAPLQIIKHYIQEVGDPWSILFLLSPQMKFLRFFLFVCTFIICSVILKNKLNGLFWLITWGLMAAKEKY